MLKNFETKQQAEIYLVGEKIRMEKGYLTRSEREELKKYLGKPELLVKKIIPMVPTKALPIITDMNILKHPIAKVVAGEDIKNIVRSLKETIAGKGGSIGLSAPQIGINKRISLISIPSINAEKKRIDYKELVLINPKIVEQDELIEVKGEGCVSFPGLRINTDRYIYCTVEYLDENLKPQVYTAQDLESFAIQHEVDHLNGILLFDRKHKAR
jgi:peptide deformylase